VKKIELKHSRGIYDILIGGNLISDLGSMIKRLDGFGINNLKCCIVSDDNVFDIYGGKVADSLETAGFSVKNFIFRHGEEQKTLTTVNDIYIFLCENNFNRNDFLIALGGGVVGDITGFAAATYLRGIKFIQVATTLLAQVDSSVGGKTGVDLPLGKNLVGAFHQPSLVVCDTDTLKTLPEIIYADGMGEVIKHGCIANRDLFYALKNKSVNQTDMIYENIKIKAEIVSNDEQETKGDRIKLNFGHTLGHAIEKYYNFSGITHGCTVSIGMIYAAKISYLLGLCDYDVIKEIKEILDIYKLPSGIETDIDIYKLAKYCTADKKSESSGIQFVLLTEIGRCTVQKIYIEDLHGLLCKCNEIEV